MEIARLVLEYVKVLLSTPPVVGAAVVVFLWMFREPIKAQLHKGGSAKVKAGNVSLSVSSSQSAQLAPERPEAEAVTIVLPAPDKQPARTLPSGAPAADSPDAKRIRELELQVKREQGAAKGWEYLYLGKFLVFHTQQVLDWIATVGPALYSLYETAWSDQIPDPGERRAVIMALVQSQLAAIKGETIYVTDKGREYRAWRGPLPPPPSTPLAPPPIPPPRLPPRGGEHFGLGKRITDE